MLSRPEGSVCTLLAELPKEIIEFLTGLDVMTKLIYRICTFRKVDSGSASAQKLKILGPRVNKNFIGGDPFVFD